ncbi:hypothetical protein HK100_003097 [Physocladia obscura]|uniref:Uncharacterized protein n=1 Tax=Physocladia obscura TaxID=109957 RepID=A0AAD5XH24_9FUNG|nr:hypothetical protein HK100_003097 [Physocladia obscura]
MVSSHGIPGLSLWIGPPKGTALDNKLNATISKYISETGVAQWGAHITLLGSVIDSPEQAAARIADVVKINNIKPFSVRLVDVVTKDLFFQSVVAKAEETPELMSFNNLLRNLYAPPSSENYWPHLSLVYGNVDAARKAEIVREILDEGGIVDEIVKVGVVEIWNTEGELADWKKVGSVILG